MPDIRRFLLGSLVATAAIATPSAARTERLFDGRSLAGWTRVGDADWAVRDGALSATAGPMSFLVSAKSYRDFELRAEFWVSADANSGIFLRCSDPAKITADNAYEANIFDTRPDPSYGTGSIVGVAKVSPMPKAGGHWNVMTIRARGDTFSVVLNGRTTVDRARDGKFRQGPVALQYGLGVVKFRKLEIRPL